MKKLTKPFLSLLSIIVAITFLCVSCDTPTNSSPEYGNPGTIQPPSNPESPEQTDVYFTITYKTDLGILPDSIKSGISVKENTILIDEQLPALSDDNAIFKGWYDGEAKAVAGEYKVTKNVTLVAKWGDEATVSYSSVFGTAPTSFTAKLNQTFSAENLGAIDCSPYTFLGWFYSKDEKSNGSGTQTEVGKKITADTTLYAKWQTAIITFETQFGEVSSIIKYTGEKIAESEIKTLNESGYTFGGWFKGSTQLTSDYTVTGDVTFTAKWTPKEYKIIFNANNGTGDAKTQTVTYGKTEKLNSCSFTYNGYRLVSWNTLADGSGTSYSNEADFVVTSANDIILYAQWIEADRFLISYQNIKGVENNNPTSYRESIGATISDLSLTGYIFEGWYDSCDTDGNGAGEKVVSWNANEKSGDITLTAKWTPISYTIKFDANGGEGSVDDIVAKYDEELILPECSFSKIGCRFNGWSSYGNATKNAGDVVKNLTSENNAIIKMYAVWQVKYLTIYYHYNFGTENPQTEGIYASQNKTVTKTLNNLRTGYNFDGWYEDENCSGEKITGWKGYTKDDDIHLWAKWQPITYTIKFDANGGEGEIPNDIAALYDKEITIPLTVPSREKYKFLYWSSCYAGYKDLYPGKKYTNIYRWEGSITYKAVWGDLTEYYHTLSFHANCEDTDSKTIRFNEAQNVNEENNTYLKNGLSRVGYTFVGWYETSDCSGEKFTGWNWGEKTEDFTLYAKWTPNTNTRYKVMHYKENLAGAYLSDKTQTLTGTTGSITNAKPQDYDGFTPQSFEQATIAADGSTVISIYYNRKTVTVTLDLNGGTGSETQFTGKYGQSFSLPTDVVKSGYSLSWTDADGNEVTATSFPANDTTYTAKWTANSAAINVSAPTYSDISLNWCGSLLLNSVNSSVEFHLSGSYESYLWTVDGVNLSETGSSITLKQNDFSSGQHFVMVTVKDKAGNYYSASKQITVQK